MAGGHKIRSIGPEAAQDALEETQNSRDGAQSSDQNRSSYEVESEEALDLSDYEESPFEEPSDSRFAWLVPALAITTILGWTGLYGWAMQAELSSAATAAPSEWTRWIIDWSVPVLLVCVVWILSMRHSRAEAKRFAQTASLLSQESRELEARLTVVNRELSLAREFLGAQSLELESLGRVASEKLSTHAAELQTLIKNNGVQVDAIGSASETALSNMKRLRDDLPVVANSARDVSNQVGNAGRNAHEQLGKLISGFERLNQFGTASENQVGALSSKVTETLASFEAHLTRIEEFTANRFGSLKEQASEYRGEIAEAEGTALSALNDRIAVLQAETKAIATQLRDAEAMAIQQFVASRDSFETDMRNTIEQLDQLHQQAMTVAQQRVKDVQEEAARFDDRLAIRDTKFLEEMTRRQEQFEERENRASEILAQRLAQLDSEIDQRRQNQIAQTEALVAKSKAMNDELERLTGLIDAVGTHSEETRSTLTEGLEAFDEQLAAKRAALGETESQLSGLTEAGIRLLEIIQSGAKHSREDLPAAIETASGNLSAIEERTSKLSDMMFCTRKQADDLGEYLITTRTQIEDTDRSIGDLQSRLAEQSEDTLARIQGLRSGFAKLAEKSDEFAGKTQESLRVALTNLENATVSAFDTLDDGARSRIAALANDISSEAVAGIEQALTKDTEETVKQLEASARQASTMGKQTAGELREQLAKLNELTGNLEQRVARARELAEEQVNNDFARRMALITDSLNSSAIDISTSLATDVSDTAWEAYLKGDRGIFTRRAVRLIDTGEAREIAELYQRDEKFRGNVSRFIHDFEAMLRSMLSTRDGNALGVTILGSDVGKLYVVLAQAIERLRN